MGGRRPRQVGIRLPAAQFTPLETGQELENNDPMQSLKEKLASGRFVMTAEITPPVSCNAADLVAKAAPLKGLADAINVTDGAGARAHLDAVAAAAILLREGIEPILQFNCRDSNRIALQSELMGAAALGIRNLLLLKGDDPRQGDQPEAKPVFDYDTAALTKVAAALRDRGELPTGRKVGGRAEFFIAAADVPIDPPAGWQPNSLKGKIEAGCEFVQTQFCMDAGVARRYLARLAEHGVTLPFLIGISPLRSAKSARWMKEKLFGTIIPDAMIARLEAAGDPAAEGRRLCLDLMRELAAIPGVAGVHIMAPGNEAAIADVIRDAAGIQRAT
jgi:methylenetetrahydrofolate reductase (NADPH)